MIALWVMIAVVQAWAQAPTPYELPKVALKTNITDLVSPFKPTLTLGTEIRLTRQFTAEFGYGYIFDGFPYADEEEESYTGALWRFNSKYYYRIHPQKSSYWGIELKRTDVTNEHWLQFSRQGNAYEEVRLVNRTVLTESIGGKIGKLIKLGATGKIFLDVYFGLNFRWNKVAVDLPEDAILVEETVGFLEPNFYLPYGKTQRSGLLGGVYLVWVVGQ
ncbi:MAG: hypothetical protein R2795_12310 [Saprospiraceae bacterium]